MAVNRSDGRWYRYLTAWPRRVPLTLALAAVIVTVALLTGAVMTGTPAATVARWGFSLDNLRHGRILTIFTGDMMVYNRHHLLAILVMLAGFVAPVEWLGGSRLTATIFWPGSISGSVITGLIVALIGPLIGWHPHPDLVAMADIGASVGTWSAAGALTVLLAAVDSRLVWPVRIGLAAFLAARIILVAGSADLAHALGFCIGMSIARAWTMTRIRMQMSPGKAS